MRKKLREAFVFTLPLMLVDATRKKLTNTVSASAKFAPINQMLHASELVDATFTDIVTPNSDTIYSQSFLDLKDDAVILQFPKTDRFSTVQVLDAYTNTITVLDATTLEKDVEKFIFCTSGFSGEIPTDVKKIESPTNLVWILIRTICNNKEDVANVAAIQKKMDTYTLTQYLTGTTAVKPDGIYEEKNNFVPIQYIQKMGMEEYFSIANELMLDNPPANEDEPVMKRMAEIQVGPGMAFDKLIFGEEADAMWLDIKKNMLNECLKNSLGYMVQNRQWMYFGKPVAEFGTAYEYRGLIAIAGLGANPVSTAIYPKAEYDLEKQHFNGANKYIMHFESGQLPPVKENGFWSVTAYNSANDLLIDNELNRYLINDRSDVKYNEDGSLDIYIQHERPEEDKVVNWLPVCEGEFHFILRIYLPTDEAVNNEWPTPVIYKIS